MADDQNEILSTVLGVTRNQLSNAMKLSSELEALLIIERQKTSDLLKENNALSVELQNFKNVDSRKKSS